VNDAYDNAQTDRAILEAINNPCFEWNCRWIVATDVSAQSLALALHTYEHLLERRGELTLAEYYGPPASSVEPPTMRDYPQRVR